jgi:hypothetical protein
MAGTKRCPKCGLMQMARPQCKKCGAPLAASGVARRTASPAPASPPAPSGSNPYAPPEVGLSAPQGDGGSSGVWRDGRFLVAAKNAALPNRCVKCNRPTNFKLKKKYYWHPPAWYLLVLLNVLIYALVALAVRKSAEVEVPLCEDHQRRRKTSMLMGALLPVVGIGACIFGGSSEGLIVIGVGTTVLGLVWLVIANQLLVPNRIDENIIRLKGVSSEYLSILPPYLGTRA